MLYGLHFYVVTCIHVRRVQIVDQAKLSRLCYIKIQIDNKLGHVWGCKLAWTHLYVLCHQTALDYPTKPTQYKNWIKIGHVLLGLVFIGLLPRNPNSSKLTRVFLSLIYKDYYIFRNTCKKLMYLLLDISDDSIYHHVWRRNRIRSRRKFNFRYWYWY